jgi:hypothetical protein
MIILLTIFNFCIADIYIFSPDALSKSIIQCSTATFGNPYLYPTYGKLEFIQTLDKCGISAPLPPNSYAIIYNSGPCYYSDLALSVQSQGGIGAIFTNFPIDDFLSPKTLEDGNQVNILVIGISTKDSNLLSEYNNKEIWISYNFNTIASSLPSINIQLSSNYTQDKAYIVPLLSINNNIPIYKSEFSVTFLSSLSFYSSTDCIKNKEGISFCLPDTSTVSGSEKLLNTFGIINYYISYSNTDIGAFLSYLDALYRTCEFNYTTQCHSSVLLQYGAILDTSSVVSSYSVSEYWIETLLYINSVLFLYPSYIEQAYCLSFYDIPSNCPTCSPECSHADLNSSSCVSSCNVSACGNQNLVCLREDGCYSFMLKDQNCNALCNNDPDCENGSNISSLLTFVLIPVAILVM